MAEEVFGDAAAAKLDLAEGRAYDDVTITTWSALRSELKLAPKLSDKENQAKFDAAILQRRKSFESDSRGVEVLEAPPSYPTADAAVVANGEELAVGFRTGPRVWSFSGLKGSKIGRAHV